MVEMALSHSAGIYNTALLPVQACRIHRPEPTKRESLSVPSELTSYYIDDRFELEPNETHTYAWISSFDTRGGIRTEQSGAAKIG